MHNLVNFQLTRRQTCCYMKTLVNTGKQNYLQETQLLLTN